MKPKKYIGILFIGLLFSTSSLFGQLNKQYFFNLGRNYLSREQYAEAISSLNQLIRVDTTIAEAWFLRGVAKYYLNDLHGAQFDFTKTINHNPVFSQAYLYRGVVMSRFSKYNQAFLDFEMAIDLRPNSPDAYYSRGVSHLLTQQAEKAIKDFSHVIKLEPRNADAFLNRGIAYLMSSDTLSALKDYQHAIPLNPFNAEPYSKRGKLYYEMKDYFLAIKDFDQAINLDSSASINFFFRALTYNELKEIDKAIADLNKAIVLSPDNALSIYNRALMMWQKGDTRAALRDFDRVAELNPDNMLVFFNRGVLLYESNNFFDAIHDFSTAIELYPDFAKAYLGRSSAFARLGNWAESERDKIFAHSIAERYSDQHNQPLTDTSQHFKNLIAFSADFSQSAINPSLDGYDTKTIDILPFIRVTLIPRHKLITTTQNFVPIDTLNNLLINEDYQFTLLASSEVSGLNIDETWHQETFINVFIEGIRYSAQGKFNQAAESYQKTLDIAPDNPLSLLNLAVEKAEMVNFISTFEKEVGSIEFGQSSRKSYRTTTSSSIQLISFEESMELLNKLETIIPDHYIVYYNKANIFALSGDMRTAISLYNKTIEKNPLMAEAWYNRGLVYLMLKENDKGCTDLGMAGELGNRQAYLLIHRFCRK